MEKECDFDGLLHILDRVEDYFASIGQMPWLDHWLVKNPLRRIEPPSFDAADAFAYQQIMTRKADKDHAGVQGDFLDDFLDLGGDNINFVLRGTFTHVVAGAHTTAIQLKAAVYYIVRTLGVQVKLQKELDVAELSLPIAILPSTTFRT
ncbi:hypothetical protein GJ744_010774 [Endocarpon pusillum]|uniref:Uncharacterized protein n=1 Tax=Endocarpon pusillum TaxID=364733 RepID=A0A8H7AHL2_9EURO|nr:hypothetical protein GJ744_010774 [Endocarpon pusillum]